MAGLPGQKQAGKESEHILIPNTSDDAGNISDTSPLISNEKGNTSDESTEDDSKELYLITKNYPSRDNFIEGLTLIKLTKSSRDIVKNASRESFTNKRIQEIIVDSYDLKLDNSHVVLKPGSPSTEPSKSNITVGKSRNHPLNEQILSSSNDNETSEEIEIKKSIIYDQTNGTNEGDTKTVDCPCNLTKNKTNLTPKKNDHDGFIYKTSCSCSLKINENKKETPTSTSKNKDDMKFISEAYPENVAHSKTAKSNLSRKNKKGRKKIKNNITINVLSKNLKKKEQEREFFERVALLAAVIVLLTVGLVSVLHLSGQSKEVVYKFHEKNSLDSELEGMYKRKFMVKEINLKKDTIVFKEMHVSSPKRKKAHKKLEQQFYLYKDMDFIDKLIENLTSNKTK